MLSSTVRQGGYDEIEPWTHDGCEGVGNSMMLDIEIFKVIHRSHSPSRLIHISHAGGQSPLVYKHERSVWMI